MKDGALGDFYEYTPEGLLKCAISAGMRYAYEYDALDRMIRKSASGRTLLALAYDGNGNKVRQTDVAGKVTQFVYSPLDLLTEVWDDGHRLAAYEYNADGTIRAESHGPVQRQFQYDLDKNLTGLLVQSGGELLAENQYLYDGNGNRTLKRQLGGDTLYHYDPLNQLKKVEYPSYTEELFYDKAGNRTRRIASGVEELYQYDPRNRLTAYTKGGVTTMFQYDHAGNLLADDKARYSYDAFNRTEKVETFDGHIQLNRYDAEGLRYEMEENGNLVRFIFNQNREVVAEEDNSGLNRLIRASELIAANSSADSARTYYHYASDEMGSTTHIVNGAGTVQNRYGYDAWGNITSQEETVPNRFKFTGQQLDPVTQQYYLRARFYNPVVAQFTQEDTYRGDGLNLYAYCANNPVTYADPTGHAPQCLKDAFDKAIAEGKSTTEAYKLTFDKAIADGKSTTEAYKLAKEVYWENVKGGTSRRDDALATLKSVRRHVEVEMKTDPNAQGFLNSKNYKRYGTYFHGQVAEYMKLDSVQSAFPELQVNRRLYQNEINGSRTGRYRVPDYQWGKPGTPDYQIWDLKPDQYAWVGSPQHNDFVNWTGTTPIQLGYHR